MSDGMLVLGVVSSKMYMETYIPVYKCKYRCSFTQPCKVTKPQILIMKPSMKRYNKAVVLGFPLGGEMTHNITVGLFTSTL